MAEPITIFSGAPGGLHNKADAVSVPDGSIPIAYNIDVDLAGRVSRRKGFTKRVSGGAHSIFCDDGVTCLFVAGTNLKQLHNDYSVSVIRANITSGARMSYCQIEEEIYYTNGYENGVFVGGSSYSWEGDAYVGPTTYKTFSDAPLGHLLAKYNGRIMVADEDIIWYSEPFAYSWFDLARGFYPCGSKVQMIQPVKGGIYVSNESETFFLGGDYTSFDKTVIANYPAILGTNVSVPGEKVGGGQLGLIGIVGMWLSPEGICVGAAGGQFINLTSEKLVLPSSNYGAGLYTDGKYVATLEP